MNKGLYKHINRRYIYFYKTWENSIKNSGVTIAIWDLPMNKNKWSWVNCDDDEDDYGVLMGAACLAQW